MIYDVETYPNLFCMATKQPGGPEYMFELSWRRWEREALINFLARQQLMIGFNNLGFDWPVVQFILDNPLASTGAIFNKAMAIIKSGDRFKHVVWQPTVPQLDLYKVHHFDNPAKATSLKSLEFAMRMESIEDLPFPPGSWLTSHEINIVKGYNRHDVKATELFLTHSQEQLAFRHQLTQQTGVDMMNFNDTKIGKQYFIAELERAGVQCYVKTDRGRRPVQTPRPSGINLGDVILSHIYFKRPEFRAILEQMKRTTITNTKAAMNLSCVINGFRFDFGTGGLHGSVENMAIRADDTYTIIDVDVKSYYPNLAIANRFSPAHLGEKFCEIYKALYDKRKVTKKGSAENQMLKLALNGVYGDSGSEYSCFYDPQYTMSITINGQLLLCMLAEMLTDHPEIDLLQANTDGLSIRCPRDVVPFVKEKCRYWEKFTGLELEDVEYKAMFIADVNSYLAIPAEGKKIKRIGRYSHETAIENPATRELGWHKDHSALVIPKAAEAYLVHGIDVQSFVDNHLNNPANIYDFMIRGKVNRGSRLEMVDFYDNKVPVQSTVRYFVSTSNWELIKVMPPLKGETKDRRISLCAGRRVTLANRMADVNPDDIDTEYYAAEAKKLVECFL